MKTVLSITSVGLILVGCIWFLQGINILPGSFMTGQIEWAVYGAMVVAGGIGLFRFSTRGGQSDSPDNQD